MPLPPPPPTAGQNHDTGRTPSREDRLWAPGTNPWLLVGTLIGAKIATIVVIMVFSWNAQTGGMVLATNWHWLVVIGALLAAPAAYWVRVRRVRRRVEALRRAEWMLDSPQATASRR